ncbi:serine/threonine-protein phosphatase 6 regulatory ankyrin repeat subunit C-like [Pomacea canaliculata]|uniref:serine/threonine-protein phosphatase 6 regulatory ankyrin repeat subunit C-like n=1 Tax=Pomacea canaliculata TaxID=400727 RepID=UPI000D736F12|nr:serine/threonine-protein phosphatase 6 regulatory ankyrin repeat subunit C-like [Pomacea canaliculata]
MMQNSSQSITVLLSSAAEDGDWDLVKDVISHGDVTATEVTQSFLLQKLASATGISQHLVKNILKNIFSNRSTSDTLKYVAEEAVVRAAHCDKWDILISFLSLGDILLEDDTNLLLVTELMASSEYLRKSYYLQTDVFICVWKHAKQKILDSTDKRVQNTLVQLAAELNMWSRVCDLLAAKPDLNLLDRDGLSVLHRLVMCPDNRFDSLLPVLLEKGADVSIKNSEGDTALHLAASCQNIGSVGKSLHLGDCNGGEQSTDFWSKIMEEYHLKCSESKQQALKTLVESCEDLDKRDSLGNTAMILAAKNKNWEFVKLLIEHGASTDLVDDNWRSVLHVLALTGGQMDPLLVTKIVEQCKSQINDTDLNGSSPLHLAVCSQSWTVFKVLLDLGGETGRRDGSGYTVLHTLAGTGRDQVQHVTSLFTLLTKQGVDLNIPCPAGNTVLHIAAMQRNWTLVKHLMHSGVDAERCNAEGFSVIHLLVFSYLHSQESYEEASLDRDLNTFLSSLALSLHKRNATFNWAVVNFLIQHGAHNQELDEERIHVLQRLIQSPKETQVTVSIFSLLMKEAERNMRFSCRDYTAMLQLSAKHEKWSFVDYILTRHGGDVDELDSEGFSVLHRMAISRGKTFKEGHFYEVKSFLRYSLYLNTNYQVTFLILEAAAERNVDVVEALLDYFEEVNRTDCQGFTVLHRVAQCCVSKSVTIVHRLVEKGADVDQQCPYGNTAVHLAAKSNNWLIVQHLLMCGSSTKNLDSEGMLVLHRLISQPCLRCHICHIGPPAKRPVCLLSAILANGASIGQKDCNNNSPLQLAIKYEHWDMALELMSRGAILNEPDPEGCTILHILAKRDNLIRGEMALERNCVACCLESDQDRPFHFLFSALAKQNINHLDICNTIVDHSNIIDSLDPYGNTALILSAKNNNLDITEQLLTKGAKPGLVNYNGLSTLHALAIAKHTTSGDLQNKIVRRLISLGVDVNARDSEGHTPVQLAAMHGNMDMVEVLLEFPVIVNETDSEGFTLLSRVAQTLSPKCKDITKRLVSKGADVNMTCPDGKSPLLLSVIARNWPSDITVVGFNIEKQYRCCTARALPHSPSPD